MAQLFKIYCSNWLVTAVQLQKKHQLRHEIEYWIEGTLQAVSAGFFLFHSSLFNNADVLLLLLNIFFVLKFLV